MVAVRDGNNCARSLRSMVRINLVSRAAATVPETEHLAAALVALIAGAPTGRKARAAGLISHG
jgi:hypothetical protein